MTTLFISDLHLEPARPDIGEQFLTFLKGEAQQAKALYILGDLFEAWLGDDDPNPYYADMKRALREFTDGGTPTYFMHGNRDFMIGDDFATETGITLLSDPSVLTIQGYNVILSHGDAMCTDDVEYQAVRKMTRNPDWQAMMRAKPIEERIAFALEARKQSIQRGSQIDDYIADVNDDAVVALLAESGADVLLHGHTHRPGIHEIKIADRLAKRVVLGDWYDHGSIVRWSESGPELSVMPRAEFPSENETRRPMSK